MAYVDRDGTRLVSRRGNVYRGFPRLRVAIQAEICREAAVDGEIVCPDVERRPQFYRLACDPSR